MYSVVINNITGTRIFNGFDSESGAARWASNYWSAYTIITS